jgi:hypothetical protein
MGTGNYTDQFKQGAVAQVTERGYTMLSAVRVAQENVAVAEQQHPFMI